jgi:hypothetical protein
MAHDYTFGSSSLIKDYKWYAKDGLDCAQSLFATVRDINFNQTGREADNWLYLRLYNGQTVTPYAGSDIATTLDRVQSGPKGLSLNAIQSIIDTIVAKVSVTDIKVEFLTDGGDYKEQEKAKILNQFAEGILYHNCVRGSAPDCLRDACIMDLGVMKVYEPYDKPGEIKIERVFTNEIIVEPLEAIYGHPRSIYQRKLVAREVILAMFPEYQKEIEEAINEKSNTGALSDSIDQILVLEAWHLPSKSGAKDGRHVLALNTVVLHEEPWVREDFPFCFLRYLKRPIGFFGQGIADILAAVQIEMNRLVKNQQRSLYLLGTPRWFVKRGSKINKVHLNNEIGAIIEGDGDPPELLTFNPVIEQVVQQIETLWMKCYEMTGISTQSAQSVTPSNLDSGAAIREHDNIETERFACVFKQYEDFHLEIIKKCVALAREITKRDGKFSMKVPGHKFLNGLEFGDIALEDEDYVLKIYPTNLLPKTPEGRLNSIQDLLKAGMLDPRQGRRLLGFPDLKAADELDNAAEENIYWQINEMQSKGVYHPPEPFQDLLLGTKLVGEAYLKAQRIGVEEEKLELFRTWLAQAKALMAPPPVAGPPSAGPTGILPPPLPIGVPTAPLKSPLLPNSPPGVTNG